MSLETLRETFARFEPLALPHEGRRHAAVALVLLEEGLGAEVPGLERPSSWSREPAALLTRRAGGMRQHAGQWALPGGRIDAGETPEEAARRELLEEVGLVLPEAALLGRLDDYATRSGYVITPLLMVTQGLPEAEAATRRMQPNPEEVAGIHRLRLRELQRADAPLLNTLPDTGTTALRMPVGSAWIAAPTAAFLYQLRELSLGRITRVAHFDQPRFAWQ